MNFFFNIFRKMLSILSSFLSFSKLLNNFTVILSKIISISYALSQFIRMQIKKDVSFWSFLLSILSYFYKKIKNNFVINKTVKTKVPTSVLPVNQISKTRLLFITVYRIFQLLLLLSVGSVLLEYNPTAASEFSNNFGDFFVLLKDYLLSFTVLASSFYAYLKIFLGDIYLKYFEFIGKIPGLLKEALGCFIDLLEKILQKIKYFFGLTVAGDTPEIVTAEKDLPLPSSSSIPENFPIEVPWALKEKNNSTLDITTNNKNIAVSADVPEKSDFISQILWGTFIVVTASVVTVSVILFSAHLCGINTDTDISTFVRDVGRSAVEASDSTVRFAKNFSSATFNSIHGTTIGQNIAASNAHRLELIQISDLINQNLESGVSLVNNFNSNLDNIRQALISGLDTSQEGPFSPSQFHHFFGAVGGAVSSLDSSPTQFPMPLAPNSAGEIDILYHWEARNLLQMEKLAAANPPIVALFDLPAAPSQVTPANFAVNLTGVPEGYSVWDTVNPNQVKEAVVVANSSSSVALAPSPIIGPELELDKSISSSGSETPKALQVSSSIALAGVSQEALDAAAEVALKAVPASSPIVPIVPETIEISVTSNPLTAPVSIKSESNFYCYDRRRSRLFLSTALVNKKIKKILTNPFMRTPSLIQVQSKKNFYNLQVRKFSSAPAPGVADTDSPAEASADAEIRKNKRVEGGFLFIKNYINRVENLPLLNTYLMGEIITEFWDRVMNNLSENEYVILLIRVDYVNGKYITLDKVRRINRLDQKSLKDSLKKNIEEFSDYYSKHEILEITLDYRVKESAAGWVNKSDFSKTSFRKKNNYPASAIKKYDNILMKYKLPLNNNYKSWGIVKYESPRYWVIRDRHNIKKEYHIDFSDRKGEPVTVQVIIGRKTIYTFKDSIDRKWLIRRLNSSDFYLKNNKIALRKNHFKVEVLKPLKKEKKMVNNFITYDLETKVISEDHVPYCVSFYDGREKFSFYLTDFSSPQEMLKTAFKELFRSKYTGFQIYVHNLSKFDGILFLSALVELSIENKIKISPIFRDNIMISINIKFGPRFKYNISFRDSFLMLPHSLEDLSSQFKVAHTKTSFPHSFLDDQYNKNIDLNYVGKIPNVDYFYHTYNSTKEETSVALVHQKYNQFIDDYFKNSKEDLQPSNKDSLASLSTKILDNWSLKKEVIRYCTNDCVSLYEVMAKFNEHIFKEFSINIHSRPTAPSLTFAIFRSNYLAELEKEGYYIPLINGKAYQEIKNSYTGGATDLYLSSNLFSGKLVNGKLVIELDVNSLYSKSMSKHMMMPVVHKSRKYITYFEGDVSQIDKNAFGFFNVEIETTRELEHPILQVRRTVKKEKGTSTNTISPLGKWTGMYFSEELKNAEKYGYKYKILSGYLFEKHDVFARFIKDIFKIKKAHSSDEPWYHIAKLLLNSLYGRFGMDPNFETTAIINESELESYLDKFEVINCKTLDNKKILITYKEIKNFHELTESNVKAKNVSIAIASAITSYARIFMSQFKNNPDFILLYTDTDSIFIIGELDPKWIGKKLGQFKIVNTYKKWVGLAPKIYGGITVNGEEVIKVVGFKNKISFSDLESLLIKDSSLELNQDMWFKDIGRGKITIKKQIYTLAISENKREMVYDENNVLIGTKPFVINDTAVAGVANAGDEKNK